mmetsp:Transcript_33908/g.112181  ORF Transcript_33908/g.112181 Transcript_33908/m.112181 type:complete len:240 (+) Transcript_33908:2827-3546(+)
MRPDRSSPGHEYRAFQLQSHLYGLFVSVSPSFSPGAKKPAKPSRLERAFATCTAGSVAPGGTPSGNVSRTSCASSSLPTQVSGGMAICWMRAASGKPARGAPYLMSLQPGMTPLIMLLIKRCQSSAGRLAARSRFETARRKPANMSVMPLPRHALKMLTVVLGPKRMPCAYVLPHSEKKSLSGRKRPSAPDCVMSWKNFPPNENCVANHCPPELPEMCVKSRQSMPTVSSLKACERARP